MSKKFDIASVFGVFGVEKKKDESMDDYLMRCAQDLEDNPPWTDRQEQCWNAFLEDLEKEKDSKTRKSILKRAHAKEYHDFESEDSKFAMEIDLRYAGYKDMRDNCVNGKYDF